MLLWVAAWFGVVLPGHDRGRVKLPGFADQTAGQGAAARAAACPLCVTSSPDSAGADSQGQDPLPAGGSCCAICQFTATLSVPPVFAFDPPDSYLIDELAVTPLPGVGETRGVAAVRSRGPPVG